MSRWHKQQANGRNRLNSGVSFVWLGAHFDHPKTCFRDNTFSLRKLLAVRLKRRAANTDLKTLTDLLDFRRLRPLKTNNTLMIFSAKIWPE